MALYKSSDHNLNMSNGTKASAMTTMITPSTAEPKTAKFMKSPKVISTLST